MSNHILLSIFSLLLLLSSQSAYDPTDQTMSRKFEPSALDHIVGKGLQDGKDIAADRNVINLSVIMTNMETKVAKSPMSMLTHLDAYLKSLLDHLTKETRLRLIILTDHGLADLLENHLKM